MEGTEIVSVQHMAFLMLRKADGKHGQIEQHMNT
jgi:hypothetical protein